jgi:methylthioribulose-1-phosphate dehydratase
MPQMLPPRPPELRTAAEALVAAGRALDAQQLCPATSGNLSVRLSDGRCAITVSGRHKGHLRADDIMLVDLAGRPLEDKKPSAETRLHTQLYRLRSDVGAVLHTHSRTTTVLSRVWPESTLRLHNYELLKAIEGIATHAVTLTVPLFDNTQALEELEPVVEAALAKDENARCYLIRGHGAYTWARTLDDCLRHVEALEFMFACELEQLRLRGAP